MVLFLFELVVAAAAGANFESVITALGSGATARSREFHNTILSCDIGGGTSNVSNSRFPEQIHDGITVLGPGVELPRGITVDQGCYLSASYPAASLRKLRKLARGSSYLSEKVADGV